METAHFILLRNLFDSAALLPPAEADAFLQKECAGDAALLQEARDLLYAYQAAASRAQGPGDAPQPADVPYQSIGPYRIRGQIGEGGMGTVFLAIRDDGTFRKSVALKVLRRDQAAADSVERFQQERQVLANLDHPNIARILDGGQTPDALPYYVMEYVEGLPLDKFCDQRKLDLEGRVLLFLQVCQAVDYLHQHLVVHRDLKPSNILVNADGVVKLLDFGIAKQQVSAANAELTAVQGRMMTPGYASPEQFSGTPITKASDIYTLGVILYLLLTGSLPHAEPGDKLTTEPSVPSSKIREDIQRTSETTSQLRRRISGDLDQVVLKCLRRNPKDRYAAASELEADLRSFLDSRPVAARQGPIGERITRFAARNRLAVAVCTLLFLLLGFGTWQAVEAKIQTQRATVLQSQVGSLLDSLEKRDAAKLPAAARVEDVNQLREAIAKNLGGEAASAEPGRNTHELTPQKKALLQRGLTYLEKVKPFAASDPALAGAIAGAYKETGVIYQPADPRAALATFTKAATMLNTATGGNASQSAYQSDWVFVSARIRTLGGAPPVAAPQSDPTTQPVASQEYARTPESKDHRERQTYARVSHSVSQAEQAPQAVPVQPPAIPADLRRKIDSVSAKTAAAEETYNELSRNAQLLGHIVHPEITARYHRMKQAFRSAQDDAASGDQESMKENLDIALALAEKLMKGGG